MKFAIYVVFGLGESMLKGLLLMLGVGILHHEWTTALPTIGYWPAVLTTIVLSGVLSRSRLEDTWRDRA